MKALFTLLSMAAAVCAQSALAPPQIGFVRDGRGAVRSVLGLAGNFVAGHTSSTDAVSASYSGSFGLIKSAAELIVTDQRGRAIARAKAPLGPALFAFSIGGEPALAYFERTQSLWSWDGKAFYPARLEFASLGAKTVLSIAVSRSNLATFLVERQDSLWELCVRTDTGAIVSQMALPGVSAPALLLAGGDLFYGDSRGLVLRKVDGSERRIAAHLPKTFLLEQMGDGWIQVSDQSTGRLFAACIKSGREQYYALPEVQR